MQQQALELRGSLERELRHAVFPRNRRFAAQIGFEYMRAAVDGRDPAPWARAALKPKPKLSRYASIR